MHSLVKDVGKYLKSKEKIAELSSAITTQKSELSRLEQAYQKLLSASKTELTGLIGKLKAEPSKKPKTRKAKKIRKAKVKKSTVRKAKTKKAKTRKVKAKKNGVATRKQIQTLLGKNKKGMLFNELATKIKDRSKATVGVTLAHMKKKKEIKRVGHTWKLAK